MLEELYKYHGYLVRFAEGYISDYAEDIVQECYLQILSGDINNNKAFKDETINLPYVVQALKFQCIKFLKAKNKIIKVEFDENYDLEHECKLQDLIEQQETHEEIRKVLRDAHFYYETLYLIYTSAENPSYRDLSEKTGISLMTIYNDMQKIKEIIENEKPM